MVGGGDMAGTAGRSGRPSAFQADLSRYDGGPRLPEGVSDAFRLKWEEVLGQLPARALRSIDVHQLRALVSLLIQAEQLETHIQEDPEDLRARRTYLATVAAVGKMSALYGLSPQDRRRLKMDGDELRDDAEEWESGGWSD
jgi:ribosomal protein S15P/S13E